MKIKTLVFLFGLLCGCYQTSTADELIDVPCTHGTSVPRPNNVTVDSYGTYSYVPQIVDPNTCESECLDLYESLAGSQSLSFPRVVYVDRAIGENVKNRWMKGIEAWNEQMDAPVLIPVLSWFTPDTQPCDIFASVVGQYDEDDVIGHASWTSCNAFLTLLDEQRFNDDLIVPIHELGHALNLPHEDDPSSIMNAIHVPNGVFSRQMICLVETAMCESGRYHVRSE